MSAPTVELAPPTVAPGNPYVGPRPMGRGERIHGRTREIDDIRGRLVSNRIMLLYSPSGAGKTSLIEAGLLPELAQRDFTVLPTIRVGYELDVVAGEPANRYAASMIASLEERLPDDAQMRPGKLVRTDLEDYLAQLEQDMPEGRLCLVFDQFEEVFTLNPVDVDAKRQFIAQLGRALKNKRFWALFAMREDFIAQLDPYLTAFPTRLRTRYRLGLLDPAAAMEAAQAPAAAQGVRFDDDAVGRLVDDLRQIKVQHLDVTTTELGPFVEPLQLQVVCRRLWDRPRASAASIGVDDVMDRGGVNEALAEYYDEAVERADKQTGAGEREIRGWVRSDLITDDGFRKPVRRGPGRNGRAVLSQLADAHLIRGERRSGTDWYELTHDRFVEPIRSSNRAFFSERRRRLTWILVAAALVAGLVIAIVLAALFWPDGETPLNATDLELGGEEDVSLERDAFERFLVSAEEGMVIEARLTFGGETAPSSSSSAQLRLLAVDGNEVGTELASDTLEALELDIADREADGDERSGSVLDVGDVLSEAPPAVVRRTVEEGEESFVVEIATQSGGEFVLGVGEVVPDEGPGELALDGRPVEAEIGAAGETVSLVVDGVAGDEIVVGVDPSESFNPVVRLRSGESDGDDLGFADAGAEGDREVFTATLAGDAPFIVEVSGFEGSTGGFSVSVEQVEIPEVEVGGGAVDGSLAAEGEVVAYSIEGGDGETVSVEVQPEGGFDPVVRVLDGSGVQLGFTDNPFEGAREAVRATLVGEAPFTLEVAGFGTSTGDFTIAVERFAPVIVEVGGDPVAAAVGVDEPLVLFSIDGSAGDDLAVSVTPAASFDPVLRVIDDAGSVLAASDNLPGDPETAAIALSDDTTITVEVSGFDGSTGDFSISARRLERIPLEVDDSPIAGELGREGDVTRFGIDAEPRSGLRVRVVPDGSLDATVAVRQSGGVEVGIANATSSGGVEEMTTIVPDDGGLIVDVSGIGGSTGSFTVAVETIETVALETGVSTFGQIAGGRSTTFQVTLPTGSGLPRIELTPESELDAVLDVVVSLGPGLILAEIRDANGSGGSEVLDLAADLPDFESPESQTWLVTVSGYEGTEGGYEIIFTP
ncbi:MAG: hypothetical protein QNJ12_10310 [Ilumatobacter sp.]|uniref:nSTAND1 domain-containing NTPase n=1 Tax=Ilumatobacter sp. TaxID=1967498 RepID=UPI00260996C7|nr:hypothetical protein [Ilumatobacter sp.]MDJ0769179.1 hypothetical protein [Ilumatobacter sp.]